MLDTAARCQHRVHQIIANGGPQSRDCSATADALSGAQQKSRVRDAAFSKVTIESG
jgi:hypothetical protein